jgi:predicted amidohydrolase YtcJ
MHRTYLTLSLATLLGQAGTTMGGGLAMVSPKPAELVLRHGAVYTLDAARSWAEAVAIDREGRIAFVGTETDVEPWIGPDTRAIDLGGAMVLPGFHDAHCHPISGGMRAFECSLYDLDSVGKICEAIRRYAERNPDEPWIRGSGWAIALFRDGNPHKSILDEVVPDRPVLLYNADGHSAWANSKALAIAGITAESPDPPDGRIERDKRTGEPAGTLHEGAMTLVARHLPEVTAEQNLAGLRGGLEEVAGLGITSLQEASASEGLLQAYAELDRRGELTARVVAAIEAKPTQGEGQVARMIELREQYKGRRLRADAVKIFVDGVLESKTAALLEPYEGSPDDRGKALWDPEVLNRTVMTLDKEGFQVHVHAIGDRAIRMALDAFEAARTANGVRDSRQHIAHLELVDPQDIPRFRRLGVIANFQPFWAQAEPSIVTLTQPFLGPKRSRWLYPIASVERSGAVVAFGSDWPVSSLDPLQGIQVAVTRRDPKREDGPAWIPEERVDLAVALAGYTINGAYLDFQERETGSIEVGKAADLVVLDRNLFEIPTADIHRTRVLYTILGGRIIHEGDGPVKER